MKGKKNEKGTTKVAAEKENLDPVKVGESSNSGPEKSGGGENSGQDYFDFIYLFFKNLFRFENVQNFLHFYRLF